MARLPRPTAAFPAPKEVKSEWLAASFSKTFTTWEAVKHKMKVFGPCCVHSNQMPAREHVLICLAVRRWWRTRPRDRRRLGSRFLNPAWAGEDATGDNRAQQGTTLRREWQYLTCGVLSNKLFHTTCTSSRPTLKLQTIDIGR
jgi:hypothetical protein